MQWATWVPRPNPVDTSSIWESHREVYICCFPFLFLGLSKTHMYQVHTPIGTWYNSSSITIVRREPAENGVLTPWRDENKCRYRTVEGGGAVLMPCMAIWKREVRKFSLKNVAFRPTPMETRSPKVLLKKKGKCQNQLHLILLSQNQVYIKTK